MPFAGDDNVEMPIIEVICVTYKQPRPLSIFVQSFLNQSAGNWRLKVIHDGPDAEYEEMMRQFRTEDDLRISYDCTNVRHNDFGHSLREKGLSQVSGDYVLITNGDNYYVPVFISLVSKIISSAKPDVVMYDMIHSHDCPGGRPLPPYSYFETEYRRWAIDMGAAVIRSELAKKAGFRDKTHDGDATYFEDVVKAAGGDLKIAKLRQVLFVHN